MAEKDAANDKVDQPQDMADWMAAMFKHEDDLKKDEALKLCQNHLKGEWLNATLEDIELKVIIAGFVNRIFSCKNTKVENDENVNASDKSCIIRLYGGKFIQPDNQLRLNGLECEVLTFYLLGEQSIGPKLYGVFNGGRLEEYLTTYSTLTDAHVTDPIAMAAVAKKYAQMHNSSIPLSREPRDYYSFLEKAFGEQLEPYKQLLCQWRDEQNDDPATQANQEALKKAYETFDEFDFVSYVQEMKSIAPRIKSKVALTHCDTNRANVMIDSSQPITVDSVRIIDFEFSGYNYRGTDIGSHFGNRRIDIAQFLRGNFDKRLPYPDRSEREHFITHYLDETRKLGVEMDPRTDTVEHVLLEAEFYGNLHQLLFFAYMVAEHEKWRHLKVRRNDPSFMLELNVEDFKRNRVSILELLRELSL